MGARGRKSGAELQIVGNGKITAVDRPPPLAELSPDMADVWCRIVDRMPAEWFPAETHDLLAQFCRHSVNASRIASMIEDLCNGNTEAQDWAGEYDRLLKMQEREGRAMSALGTRLRITQQSQVHPKKGRGTGIKAPWEKK